MTRKTYNTFYQWIKQDDFLTIWGGFIDSKNIDGIDEWYGARLWPKMNSQLTTSTYAMRWFIDRSSDPDNNWAFGDDGQIWQMDWTQFTTSIPAGEDIVWGFLNTSFYYFLTKQSNTAIKLWRISTTDANAWTWTNLTTSFPNTLVDEHSEIPPILVVNRNIAYIGMSDWVYKLWWWTQSELDFTGNDVVWITKHWTQYKVYDIDWNVFYWVWDTATSFSSSQILGFKPKRVSQSGNFDYITTFSGDLYISSGYSYQRISEKRKSNRLNDNSSYLTKFDFSNETNTTTAMDFYWDDMFIISSDSTIGVYKYGTIVDWLAKWFHKIITDDNSGTQIDEVYFVKYHTRSNKLFISYLQWSTYWIDYIDFDSKETAEDGYLVSEIFSGWTAFKKKIDTLRIARSYASGNDYVTLYKRINNASSWTQITLPTPSDDIITRDNITTETEENIDTQYKIVFHNEAQDSNSPMLHEFVYDYEIIET